MQSLKLKPKKLRLLPKSESKLAYEKAALESGFFCVAGIDEAGRGPLAGPVVAAACVLEGEIPEGIGDSKKLSGKRREELFEQLLRFPHGIGIVGPERIDEINILQATIEAMLMAARAIESADCLLVDGLDLPHESLPCQKIIKGDDLSLSIGAASILAKVTRDRMMIEADLEYPEYGFAGHKGYGTKKHREAIEKFGPCPSHRKSFEPIKSLLI